MSEKRFLYCLQCSECLMVNCKNPKWQISEKEFKLIHRNHLISILTMKEIIKHAEKKFLFKKIREKEREISSLKEIEKIKKYKRQLRNLNNIDNTYKEMIRNEH